MLEQDIQKKIIKYLEAEGAYVVKVLSANKSGVPDILSCYKGNFIAIEVKHPDRKDKVTLLQSKNLDMVTDAGGFSIVAWNLDVVKEFIEEL